MANGDFMDLGYPQAPSDEQYRRAGIVLADWAAREKAIGDLPELLDMIGYPR